MQKRNKKGFTLIELLVAIAIIGILASIGIVIFSNTQLKGRDGRRKADLDSLQKALAFYQSDTIQSAYYPVGSGGGNCDNTSSPVCIPKTALIYTGSPSYTFIKKIPKDPKTKLDYYYATFIADGSTGCAQNSPFTPATTSTCVNYKLVACLENPSDPRRDPSTDTTACGAEWSGSSMTIENY